MANFVRKRVACNSWAILGSNVGVDFACFELNASRKVRFYNAEAVATNQLPHVSPQSSAGDYRKAVEIAGKLYERDRFTNVTPRIQSLIGRNLCQQPNHPLWLTKKRIMAYFNWRYFENMRRRPVFTLIDNLSPIVTAEQNFDSLLVPPDHVSRRPSDSYYINKNYMLRAHTSAHQTELIRQGLREFLVVGDVYRRDEIDATHFPAFHQMEGVRLRFGHELFDPSGMNIDNNACNYRLFERNSDKQHRKPTRQECHTQLAVDRLERDLKDCLEGCIKSLFGHKVQLRWVDTYFPFTHPSWELEMLYDEHFQQQPRAAAAEATTPTTRSETEDQSDAVKKSKTKTKKAAEVVTPSAPTPTEPRWLEMLGCGIVEQKLLRNAGVHDDQVGWAFGLGLERIAMLLYQIPDIRLFWSNDTGFLSQFNISPNENIRKRIKYQPVSSFPQCTNDISFWLPAHQSYDKNDFFDLVRSVAGDLAEQVSLVDEFEHPKTKRRSNCYRIVYRHMEKTLTKEEVNEIHEQIAALAVKQLGVELR